MSLSWGETHDERQQTSAAVETQMRRDTTRLRAWLRGKVCLGIATEEQFRDKLGFPVGYEDCDCGLEDGEGPAGFRPGALQRL